MGLGTLGVGCQYPELFAIFLPVPSLGMSRHVTWKSKSGGLGAERSGLHMPPGHQRELASWADAVTVRCCLACQQPVRYLYDNRLHCTLSQELATEYHSCEEEVTGENVEAGEPDAYVEADVCPVSVFGPSFGKHHIACLTCSAC